LLTNYEWADPEPWQRQPGESSRAFAAFQIYRDLPPRERSVFAVAERLSYRISEARRKSRRPPGKLRIWCSRWRWVARARAWDEELDRCQRETQQQARRDMAERHARAAVAVLHRALKRLETLDPETLSPGDVIRWLETAVKIERLGRGEPTESVRSEHVADLQLQSELAIAGRIMADPRTRDLEFEILRLVAARAALSGGSGPARQPGPLDLGSASGAAQPAADCGDARTDPPLTRDHAAAPRQE
jgi:hypothetical protein